MTNYFCLYSDLVRVHFPFEKMSNAERAHYNYDFMRHNLHFVAKFFPTPINVNLDYVAIIWIGIQESRSKEQGDYAVKSWSEFLIILVIT